MSRQSQTLLVLLAIPLIACNGDRKAKDTKLPEVIYVDKGTNSDLDATDSKADRLESVQDDSDKPTELQALNLGETVLLCKRTDSVNAMGLATIGCRTELAGNHISNFQEQASNLVWSVNTNQVQIETSFVDNTSDANWLQVINLTLVDSVAVSSIDFSLTFDFNGSSYIIKDQVNLVWDKNCAKPLVDFEKLGLANEAQLQNQLGIEHGIQFSTLSGNPIFIAGYNAPAPAGYFGGPDNTANYLAPNQAGKQYFITDGRKAAEATDTIVISYITPTDGLSFDVVDVDFSETVVAQAFDANDVLIDEQSLASPTADFLDGKLAKMILRDPNGEATIAKVQIVANNPPGSNGIGYGIDNLSPRCIR